MTSKTFQFSLFFILIHIQYAISGSCEPSRIVDLIKERPDKHLPTPLGLFTRQMKGGLEEAAEIMTRENESTRYIYQNAETARMSASLNELYNKQISPRYAWMTEKEDFAYPDGKNIVLVSPLANSLGYALPFDIEGVNIFFVGSMNSLEMIETPNGKQLAFQDAVYFDREREMMIYTSLDDYITAHYVIPSMNAHPQTYKFSRESISRFDIDEDLYKLASHKGELKDFMVRHNIPTPKHLRISSNNSPKDIQDIVLPFIDNNEFVIKLVDEAGGQGVFIYTPEERLLALEKVSELLKTNDEVLVEHRVFPENFSKLSKELDLDWNLRVLSTYDELGQKSFFDPELIEVRLMQNKNAPVNISKDADALTLLEFLGQHLDEDETQVFLRKLHTAVDKLNRTLYENYGRLPILLGHDVMLNAQNEFVFIETNIGPVGGIGTLERLNDDRPGSVIKKFLPLLEKRVKNISLPTIVEEDEIIDAVRLKHPTLYNKKLNNDFINHLLLYTDSNENESSAILLKLIKDDPYREKLLWGQLFGLFMTAGAEKKAIQLLEAGVFQYGIFHEFFILNLAVIYQKKNQHEKLRKLLTEVEEYDITIIYKLFAKLAEGLTDPS